MADGSEIMYIGLPSALYALAIQPSEIYTVDAWASDTDLHSKSSPNPFLKDLLSFPGASRLWTWHPSAPGLPQVKENVKGTTKKLLKVSRLF